MTTPSKTYTKPDLTCRPRMFCIGSLVCPWWMTDIYYVSQNCDYSGILSHSSSGTLKWIEGYAFNSLSGRHTDVSIWIPYTWLKGQSCCIPSAPWKWHLFDPYFLSPPLVTSEKMWAWFVDMILEKGDIIVFRDCFEGHTSSYREILHHTCVTPIPHSFRARVHNHCATMEIYIYTLLCYKSIQLQ